MSITKGSKTVSEYLHLAKETSEQLAAIKEPLSPADLVTYFFRGLEPDYNKLVSATLYFPPLLLFSDLRSRLLSFEAQQAMSPIIFCPAAIRFCCF